MLCRLYIIRNSNDIPLFFILKFLSETPFNTSWDSLKMLIFSTEPKKVLIINSFMQVTISKFIHTFFQCSIWREVMHDKTQNKAFYSSRRNFLVVWYKMMFLYGSAVTRKNGHRNVIGGIECELRLTQFMLFENKFTYDCSTKLCMVLSYAKSLLNWLWCRCTQNNLTIQSALD